MLLLILVAHFNLEKYFQISKQAILAKGLMVYLLDANRNYIYIPYFFIFQCRKKKKNTNVNLLRALLGMPVLFSCFLRVFLVLFSFVYALTVSSSYSLCTLHGFPLSLSLLCLLFFFLFSAFKLRRLYTRAV